MGLMRGLAEIGNHRKSNSLSEVTYSLVRVCVLCVCVFGEEGRVVLNMLEKH